MLAARWVQQVISVHCSTEKKAIDGAAMLADHLGVLITQHQSLGENDRSSTGYLPKAEFESVADLFFSNPTESIRGWETAVDAQRRIVSATHNVMNKIPEDHSTAIISHGAVGTLLLCHLNDWTIDRKHDQPGNGGGNYFSFDNNLRQVIHGWKPIDTEQT